MGTTSLSSITSQAKSKGREVALNLMLRRTYNEKWRDPSYRERSPAVDAKEDVLRELWCMVGNFKSFAPDLITGATVADIGCGTGRFLPVLADSGYNPIGIDISENCFDPDITDKFSLIVCPVTDLPDTFEVDASVCSDMMEHIPIELIDPVLAKIAKISKYGAVFGISNYTDAGQLHCSLRDGNWWEYKLHEHFPLVVRCEHGVKLYRQNRANWFLYRCGK